jgi:hypothetical protein
VSTASAGLSGVRQRRTASSNSQLKCSNVCHGAPRLLPVWQQIPRLTDHR